MDLFEINAFFQDKINSMGDVGDVETLDTAHKFLSLALSYVPNCSDPIIGLFDIPNLGIKYDGYYLDEDEKEFHLLGVLYYDDVKKLTESAVKEDLTKLFNSLGQFLKSSFMRCIPCGTETEVGEHMQELRDDVGAGYKIFIDIFSNITFSADAFPTSVQFDGIPGTTTYEYYDASYIYESINAEDSKDLIVDFKRSYGAPLSAIRVSRNAHFDVYLTAIDGITLANVYKDHKSRLMDGNVRAYLKRTQKTNRGIVQTLKDDPQDFVAYNNGISAVAALTNSDIRLIDSNLALINSLDRMQIVNGGQTTVTIYECSRDPIDLSEVVVPMKITVLKQQDEDPELTSNIAIYANTQTAIAKSDLASNKPFYIQLEAISRNTPCYRTPAHSDEDAYYWFFERANGLYNTRKRIIWNSSKKFSRQFPEKNKFTKKLLAKVLMSISMHPDIVCLGNEACFSKFNSLIESNSVVPNKEYYQKTIGALILWREADKIIKKEKLPIKAAVLPYTIAYISFKTNCRIDLGGIWANQSINSNLVEDIKVVASHVNSFFQSSLEEHPNILMYGRKSACWESIKKLDIPLDREINYTGSGFDFFPVHPAKTFIQDKSNYNNVYLWQKLLLWNDKTMVLSNSEREKVRRVIDQISVSLMVVDKKLLDSVQTIFMKASQRGFQFN